MAGGDFADDGQIGENAGDIVGAHRIAIHSRNGFGRLRTEGDQVFCKNTALSLANGHDLRPERNGVSEQPRSRFGDGNQSPVQVALRVHVPDLPPVLESRRTGPISIPLSMALAMS